MSIGTTIALSTKCSTYLEGNKPDPTRNAIYGQFAHGPHAVGINYARPLDNPLSDMTWNMKRQFKTVSSAWHAFLGLDSAPSRDGVVRRIPEL